MPDQRPDDTDLSERSSVSPDLLSIHDRLSDDGAHWRRRAPAGSELVDWARATLDYADERKWRTAGQLRTEWLEHREDEAPLPPNWKGPRRSMKMTRIQGWLGAAAVVIVVGLIAALLTRNAGLRKPTGAGATASPNAPATHEPAATPSPSLLNTQFLQPYQLPVVALSDPAIAYRMGDGTLERSSDGGATWVKETLPKSDITPTFNPSLAVSPLDANHIFMTIGGQKSGQGCPGPVSPYPSIALHGGIDAGGYIPCMEQFISVDGGRAWRKPSLPTGGALGAPDQYHGGIAPYATPSYVFQAQGQRLYSAMAFASDGDSLMDSPGVRLVASDNDGLTWRFVDVGLATSYRYVCDFGAAPTSSVLYAVTASQSCGGGGGYPTLSLWRSPNGGQNWARVRTLPTLSEAGLFVNAQGQLYSFMPTVVVQGHGASSNPTPADVMVSVNGGATFTHAPTAGLPASPTFWCIYATLPDGSVVFAASPQAPGGAGATSLYAWKPGQSAWTKISPAFQGGVVAVRVASAAGQPTMIVIGGDGSITQVKLSAGQ